MQMPLHCEIQPGYSEKDTHLASLHCWRVATRILEVYVAVWELLIALVATKDSTAQDQQRMCSYLRLQEWIEFGGCIGVDTEAVVKVSCQIVADDWQNKPVAALPAAASCSCRQSEFAAVAAAAADDDPRILRCSVGYDDCDP